MQARALSHAHPLIIKGLRWDGIWTMSLIPLGKTTVLKLALQQRDSQKQRIEILRSSSSGLHLTRGHEMV